MMDRARESRRTGSGGPVSAPRRPRTTGFKDSPVHDEDDIAEEVHNSRLRERKKDSLASVVSGTSLRNKRKRQEAPAPAHNSAADEPDESSDDSDGGATEDDDPPPIPRWPGKPRAKEESIGLDLPAVPRKARSAIVKRNHENPQPPAILAQHSPSTTTTSAAAAKPGRRIKPNGSKPRPAKVPKASPAPISEQEVEVAEALFDLARMVPNFKSETKSDSKSDKVSARAASPAANPSPLSPPSSSLNNVVSSHPAEAPRRKRPRIRPRSDEGGSRTVPVKTEMESSRTSSEKKAENSSKLPSGSSPIATPAIEAASDHLKKQENASEMKPSSVNVVTDTVTSVNAELNKRKLPSGDSRPPKFEIDLMVPPATPLQNDMVECVPDIDRKDRMEIQGGSWLDKEIKKERDKELKEKEEPRDVKLEEIDTKKEVEQVKEERECLDLNKQGIGGSRSAKGPKIDAKSAVKPDRSVSAAVVSAASSFLNASTSSCNTTPAMANWPGGYYAPPPAAVAAAAAQAAGLAATSTEDNNASHSQIMPYLTGRQSWKNCAKHVYIARFIDLQQQVARHSLMAATLGSYGAKPYNLNIPADAVYNGASSNAMNSSVSSGLALGALSERNPQSNKSSSYMDAVFRKHTTQQQQQQQQQLPAPAFGFPLSQGLPSNASSAAASTAGLSSASTASSTSAGSVASMAAQAQFFQAVMQHNPFPFPFPTSHFTSHNFSGTQNLSQQAQYVNNAFYASHLIHTTQQQAQAAALPGQSQKPQQSAGRIFSGSYGTSEKDGTAASADNKMLQRLFSQQSCNNGAPNLNAPASDPSQDYSKHVGKLQQSQPSPSQITNPALQMSLKGMESQTSQQQGNGNRGAIGPGPLGLPPVAAVMTPLMAEQSRLHQHAMQAGGQQSRSLRVAVDEMFEGSNQGNADERKLAAAKRGPSISRVDLETLPSMQGSPTSGNSSSRMANATAMNLLPASSRLQASVQGPPPVQQTLNQNMKQPVVRAKAPLSTSAPPSVTSLGDRTSRNTGPPPGIAFPPQASGLPSMPALKQQSQQVALQQQQQQQQQHAQLKQLSQRPPAVTPAPVVNPMAKPQQIPQARSPQSSAAGGAPPRVAPPGSSAPGSPSVTSMPQPPKQGSVVNAKNTNKATTFALSTPPQKQQQPPAPVVSGKRSPANSQTQQPKVMAGQPQQSTSSPQHTPAQQQQYQLSQQQVNHLQKQLPPQLRQSQMFLQPQQYQQTLSQIPQQVPNTGNLSANGLSLSSQMGGGSNGNGKSGGVIDGASSFSQGMVSKAPPLTRNSPSSSSSVNTITGVLPTQQQRVNGTTGMSMPVLQQTGSPSSISQQSGTFSVSYSGTMKPPETKNEAASPVQPSKTPGYPSHQTPGTVRQQQQPGTPGGGGPSNSTSGKGSYGDVPRTPPPGTSLCTGVCTSGSLSTMMASPSASFGNSTSTDVRVSFGNPTQQQQSVVVSPQQHIPPPAPQNILPSSSMSLTSIAVAAVSSPGLLGQSSASALRP